MLLWTFMFKFLSGHAFSLLLDIYLRMEMSVHMVTLCLTFWETTKLFSKATALFNIPASNIWGPQFLHILSHTWNCLSFLLWSFYESYHTLQITTERWINYQLDIYIVLFLQHKWGLLLFFQFAWYPFWWAKILSKHLRGLLVSSGPSEQFKAT